MSNHMGRIVLSAAFVTMACASGCRDAVKADDTTDGGGDATHSEGESIGGRDTTHPEGESIGGRADTTSGGRNATTGGAQDGSGGESAADGGTRSSGGASTGAHGGSPSDGGGAPVGGQQGSGGPGEPCPTGQFRSDEATGECTTFTDCAPGTYVAAQGWSRGDRSCRACGTATFSDVTNASTCTSWDHCEIHEVAAALPSATGNVECEPRSNLSSADGRLVTINEAGTAFTLAARGNVGVPTLLGVHEPNMPSRQVELQTGPQPADSLGFFIQKSGAVARVSALVGDTNTEASLTSFAADGKLQWTRTLGESAQHFSGFLERVRLAESPSGDALYVLGPAPTGDDESRLHVFRYDASGNQEWAVPALPSAVWPVEVLQVDSAGNIVTAGHTAEISSVVQKRTDQGESLWLTDVSELGQSLISGLATGSANLTLVWGESLDSSYPFVMGLDAQGKRKFSLGAEVSGSVLDAATQADDSFYLLTFDKAHTLLTKFDTSGQVLQQTEVAFTRYEVPLQLFVTAMGPFVGGNSQGDDYTYGYWFPAVGPLTN